MSETAGGIFFTHTVHSVIYVIVLFYFIGSSRTMRR